MTARPLTAAEIVAQELARVAEPPCCDAREQEWRELWEAKARALAADRALAAWAAGEEGV